MANQQIRNQQLLFLQALKASLENQQVSWDMDLSVQDWESLFRLAEVHHVLPMIYDAVYKCPAAQKMDRQFFAPFKQRVFRMVMLQTMKTGEFLTLYQGLKQANLKLLVVKGIICRSLYPNPDYRISSDEDLWILPNEFWQCHERMLQCGMQLSVSMEAEAMAEAYEVPYGKAGSPIYIELHKSLFPPESAAYGDLNRYFQKAPLRAVEVKIDGVSIQTMGYTDHLFYLICHAFKHFLHSGFGIRQVCDIIMYANKYGSQIDWMQILENCKEINADKFAAALFQIGSKYLVFDSDKAEYPFAWRKIKVDELPLFQDLISGGLYGDSSMSRKHSSNITLDAVVAQKQGCKAKGVMLSSVFPSVSKLVSRYPYLRKYPCLLPVAWCNRLCKYIKETKYGRDNTVADALKIGNERKELLKKYGIIR